MNINEVVKLAEPDMLAVNQCIGQQVNSDVALVNQLGMYIINSGGKRIRPMLTVLAARALGYQGEKHHTLAAIIEFIHTATLLHDDVVDESTMRRGKETANALFGNQASVLVGDFLYTRSFQMMVTLNSMRVMDILADATNVISEGEVLQLMNCNDLIPLKPVTLTLFTVKQHVCLKRPLNCQPLSQRQMKKPLKH